MRFRSSSAARAGDLGDYEAVGLSTVCGLRSQALFGPHTPLSQTAGCAGQTMPPSPQSAAGFSVGRSEVTPSGRTRLFELRHSFAERRVCRPSNLYTPRRPFVRPPSGGKPPRVQSGPSWRDWLPLASSVITGERGLAGEPGRRHAVAAGTGSARHGTPSRSMAQHRTRSFRATAMMACFLRALPRLSRL